MKRPLLLLTTLGLFLWPVHAQSHDFSPHLLRLQVSQDGAWRSQWAGPRVAGVAPVMRVPAGCVAVQTHGELFDDAWHCTVAAQEVVLQWEMPRSEPTFVHLVYAGTAQTTLWDTGSQSLRPVPASPAPLDYIPLGIEHILLGFDHLALLLLLWFMSRRGARLWPMIAAFSVGHSLTLCCVALGLISVPSDPTEAVIALSILLLAWGTLHLNEEKPIGWSWTTCIGLFHGLGFAQALAQTGLPKQQTLWALGAFNLGVELGQVAFIAVLSALGLGLRSYAITRNDTLRTLTLLAVGSLGAMWTLERIYTCFCGPL